MTNNSIYRSVKVAFRIIEGKAKAQLESAIMANRGTLTDGLKNLNLVSEEKDFAKPMADMAQDKKDVLVAQKLLNIRESAIERNIGFGMTLKEVDRLMHETKCFYSGNEITRVRGDHDSRGNNVLTFERVNDSDGYFNGNVVACSARMNKLRGEITHQEIEMLYKGMVKHGLL
jgi:hypothetical protein